MLTRLSVGLVAAVLVLTAAGAASASIVTVPLVAPGGGDSGWDVTYDDTYVDVIVDQVDHGQDFVVIQASKDFTKGPNPLTGQFPPLIMDFTQRLDDAATVATIILSDEALTNLTGVTWTDFHWQVLDHNEVWFDVAASGSFGIQPSPQFQQQQWTTWAGHPNRADALDVFDGIVVSGSSYFPGVDDSDLVIRTNLAGTASLMSFTFKQYPTPEPATLSLLVAGLAAVWMRKRRGTKGLRDGGTE